LQHLPHRDDANIGIQLYSKPQQRECESVQGYRDPSHGYRARRQCFAGWSRRRSVQDRTVMGTWTADLLPARRPNEEPAHGHPRAQQLRIRSQQLVVQFLCEPIGSTAAGRFELLTITLTSWHAA